MTGVDEFPGEAPRLGVRDAHPPKLDVVKCSGP
jgi:hypothetical protein